MKLRFTACFFILIFSSINMLMGQNSRFGFTLNSSIGIYSLKLERNESIKQSLNPILNIGLIYEFHYTEKLISEIGIGVNITKRKYEYKVEEGQHQEINFYEFIFHKNHNATYLNGFANWGYQENKFRFKIGFQTIYFTSIKDKNSYYIFTNNNGSSQRSYDMGTDENLSFLFFELNSEIGYFITDYSEIKAGYFLGIGKRSYRDLAPKQRVSIGLTKYF